MDELEQSNLDKRQMTPTTLSIRLRNIIKKEKKLS